MPSNIIDIETLLDKRVMKSDDGDITVELKEIKTVFSTGTVLVSYLVTASNIDGKAWYDALKSYNKYFKTKPCAVKRFHELRPMHCSILL